MRDSTGWSYDRIAHLYDVDMALNMPFDDVAFYLERAASSAGPVLEIGCGNGRITLPLRRQGTAVVGIDRSEPMLNALQSKARAGGVRVDVCAMDARTLGFRRVFEQVLCPYSLVTYMGAKNDAERMLAGIARALNAGGRVVIDAFIPRPGVQSAHLTTDYVRPYGDGSLRRSKRVTPLATRCNLIERRYERFDAEGLIVETIETREEIRPFEPEELLALLQACRFEPDDCWWDYGRAARGGDSRFFSVSARIRA